MPDTTPRHDTQTLLTILLQELNGRPQNGELAGLLSTATEENLPKPPLDASDTEDEYKTYCAARRVGDIVFEELVNHGGTSEAGAGKSIWLEDRRSQTVNPFYSQTVQGLRLEMYYGQPNKIHTPWGEWSICGSGSSSGGKLKVYTDAILSRLGTTTYIAEYYDNGPLGGQIGPVYDLGCIDGAPLPEVISHKRGVTPLRSYRDSNAQWRAMSDRYSEENPNAVKMKYYD